MDFTEDFLCNTIPKVTCNVKFIAEALRLTLHSVRGFFNNTEGDRSLVFCLSVISSISSFQAYLHIHIQQIPLGNLQCEMYLCVCLCVRHVKDKEVKDKDGVVPTAPVSDVLLCLIIKLTGVRRLTTWGLSI